MPYRLPPLNALRLFEAAGRHLSFKAAAEELGVTPSAVSHGIKTLEDWLGVALFRRGHRSLTLTAAGAAFLPGIQGALTQIVAASTTLPGRAADRRLTVSVAPSFGVRWLVPRLPAFTARHPEVEVALDSTQRQVDLARDGADVAIRMGRGDWPDLAASCLITESLVPVCAPAVAAAITAPADLALQTLLHVVNVSEDWAAWAAAGDVDLPLDNARGQRFDNIDMALEAAAEGLGVALGRRPLVDADLAAGRLVAVLGPPRPADTGYWLLTLPDSLARPEVTAFRDWIAGELAPKNE